MIDCNAVHELSTELWTKYGLTAELRKRKSNEKPKQIQVNLWLSIREKCSKTRYRVLLRPSSYFIIFLLIYQTLPLNFRYPFHEALVVKNTVETPLIGTSKRQGFFFVSSVHQSIHFTLIETSLQRPVNSVPGGLLKRFSTISSFCFTICNFLARSPRNTWILTD